MNILFLSISIPNGDLRDTITYNFIVKEMEALVDRGHQVFFLSDSISKIVKKNGVCYLPVCSYLENSTYLRRVKNALFYLRHIRHFGLKALVSVSRIMFICGFDRAVCRVINNFKIDVIHTHFFYPHGECAIAAALSEKVPVVATLRGAEVYARSDLEYGAMLDNKFSHIFLKSVFKVSYFTAPNREILQILNEKFDVPIMKLKYLPNGVDLVKENSTALSLKKKNTFLAVGRLIKRKNHKVLIEAFSRLDSQYRLVLVGDGPEIEELERLIRVNGLLNVSIIHEMDKKLLFELMASCLCLVNPSYIEGMPNVVMESLSIGIPCIVSNIKPHNELIVEDLNGYIFNLNDVNSLAIKMNLIIENKDVWLSRENEIIDSVSHFSLARKIEGYELIYSSLCKLK